MPNRIKELREARGLTLEQVADIAETSFQQVQRLERGERRLTDDWMRRVAKALRVEPAELLADFRPDPQSLAKKLEYELVLRIWDKMTADERALWLRFGRDRGLEILAHDPEKGHPRPRRHRRH